MQSAEADGFGCLLEGSMNIHRALRSSQIQLLRFHIRDCFSIGKQSFKFSDIFNQFKTGKMFENA